MCKEVDGLCLKLHYCTPGLVRTSAKSTPYKGLLLLLLLIETLFSEVFNRPVLRDHRIKDYNRDFVEKEWRNLSDTEYQQYYYIAFVFGFYTNLCTDDATFEIQDPAPTAHLRTPKRKRGKSTLSYQEGMISLENKKTPVVD